MNIDKLIPLDHELLNKENFSLLGFK